MIRSLYISYNAITEPIVQSQVIPYLKELSKKGVKFYLLTFEKKKMRREERRRIQEMLKEESGLEWRFLKYHKKPTVPATLFDIMAGCIYSIYFSIKNGIDVVHARAIVAALMGYPAAKLLSKKFIFDTRGIDSEEYVDAGLWKRGGLRHKIAGFLEGALIKTSDRVITLTERFLEILQARYRGKKIRFSVIPCAVDTDKFKGEKSGNAALGEKLGIGNKFIITYAGSLGTWYMFSEMADFFKIAIKVIKNAHFLVLTQSDKKHAIDVIKNKALDMGCVTITEAPSESMADYLPFCDIGIFFIKPVFSKLSSSPVKFGEYLASGLPVIINSGIGDTEKVVRSYRVGAVVERFEAADYLRAAEHVLKMLEEDKDGLRARCREAAEKELSLKTAVGIYGKIYEDIMK